MLVETKCEIVNRVLFCEKFTKGENSTFKNSGTTHNIQSQLVNNWELGTNRLYKGINRKTVSRVGNTSDNGKGIIGQAGGV